MKRLTSFVVLALAAAGAVQTPAPAPAPASADDQSLFKQFIAICDANDADAARVERQARIAGYLKTPDLYAARAVVPNIRQQKTLWKTFEGKVLVVTTGRAPVAGIPGADSDVCALSTAPAAASEVSAFRRWAEVPGTTSPAGVSYFYLQSAGPHQSLANAAGPAIQNAITSGQTRVAFSASTDASTVFILFRPKP